MDNQLEEDIHQTEEPLNQTVTENEKPKRKHKPLTPEQLEKKRLSIQKAREQKKGYKEELQKYQQKEKEAEKEKVVVEKPIEEKPKKPKKQIIREVIKEEFETDSEDTEEEVVERVIVKKIPRPPKEFSKNDLVSQTYRERLQEQLKQEKMKMIYNSLFDY